MRNSWKSVFATLEPPQRIQRTRMAVLVNGTASSAAGLRAQALLGHLGPEFQVRFFHRLAPRPVGAFLFLVRLWIFRPKICYLMDLGVTGVIAMWCYRRFYPLNAIVDMGDAISDLTAFLGRWRPVCWITQWMERVTFQAAELVIVRSVFHQRLLQDRGIQRVEVIPDGVNTQYFKPTNVEALRAHLGLEGVVTVGLQGNFSWNRRLQWGLGHELLEVLLRLKGLPVKGVLVGDGPGLKRLRQRARALGIEQNIHWAGHMPYQVLPTVLNLIDVCLITQTNELTSWVRTTGKLPCYMACGRYILASRVGTPSLLLPDEMLLDYEGPFDRLYPERLAERIRRMLDDKGRLKRGSVLVPIAQEHFDYSHLAQRVGQMLTHLESAK